MAAGKSGSQAFKLRSSDVLLKNAFFWILSKLSLPSAQFGQLVQLFSAVEIHDLKVSKVKIVKILYTIYIEPKNKFKVQILGILKEIDSFY